MNPITMGLPLHGHRYLIGMSSMPLKWQHFIMMDNHVGALLPCNSFHVDTHTHMYGRKFASTCFVPFIYTNVPLVQAHPRSHRRITLL